MKRFLVLAAILFLCAACTAFPANAQNAPSNAVWVGVAVNVTNGTVSPPILEQRIAGGGGGIDTNAFIPKWPSWYQLGTDGVSPTNNDVSGWFSNLLGYRFQRYGGNLSIGAFGPFNSFLQSYPHLYLFSGGPMYADARRFVVTSTNASSGVTFTNTVDGVFPVTWNGVTKNGWNELGLPAVYSDHLGPRWYVGESTNWFDDPWTVVDMFNLSVENYLGVAGGFSVEKRAGGTVAVLNGVAITNWSDIGGGGLSGSRVSSTDTSVVADDYLVWLDTSALGSEDEIVLDLPDMAAEAQTIVVRRLGNDGYATVRRVTATVTNTFSLGADGSAIAIDWLGARTNWYWRQAY